MSNQNSNIFGSSLGTSNTSSGIDYSLNTNTDLSNSTTPKPPSAFSGAVPVSGGSATSSDGQKNTGSGIFGGQNSRSASPASTSAPGGLFSGSATAKKPQFGAGIGATFGQQTPVSGTGPFSGPSTTPAGPPPSAVKTGIFGGGGGGLFASGGAQSNTGTANSSGTFNSQQQAQQPPKSAPGGHFGTSNTTTSSAPATRGHFSSTAPISSGLFGGNTQTSNAGSAPSSPAPAVGGLFNSKPMDSKPPVSLFGNPTGSTTPAAKAPGGGLFSGTSAASTTPAAPAPSSQALPLFGSTPAAKPPANNLFGGQSSSAAAAAPATSTAPPGGMFGNIATSNAPAPPSPAPAPAPSTSSGPPLFGSAAPASGSSLFGSPPVSKPADAPAAPVASPIGGLFGKSTASAPPAASTPTTSIAPTGGLFGPTTTGTAQTAQTPAVQTPGSTTATQRNIAAPAAVNTSMAPPPQSRLKNKSMDEIITRWTTDLEKYKAEFVMQAAEVKRWDSVLIENGDKIMNLFTETLEAEKTQGRMDTVLQQLESDQEELGTALDYYEAQIKDLFEAQMGGVEGMQPADQEREKAYHLAEKLDDQLQVMGSELGEMIKEINRASTMINKTTNADDPLSQIVKILNDHLSSLQWIDSHTTAMADKIQEAQKKSREAAGGNMGGDEDFFPSASFRSMR